MRNGLFRLAVFLVVPVEFLVAADGPIKSPQWINVNIPGQSVTTVWGINNSGVMVGVSQIPGMHGFALVGNKAIAIDVPNSTGTLCNAINSSGGIVGYDFPKSGPATRGFLYQNGKFTDIGPPGYESGATGINDSGLIVGEYYDGQTSHGFLWDGIAYQILTVPGSTATYGGGINNSRMITLLWLDSAGRTHSSIYDGSGYTAIDVPGATDTYAFGINNAGDVAFSWLYPSGASYSDVLHNGQYYKFTVPGSDQSESFGINDQDVIVGLWWKEDGSANAGFKLIP